MAHICIELAIALNYLCQAIRIVVQCFCQLAYLIFWKMRRQRLGITTASIVSQALRKNRYGTHYPRSGPPSNQETQAGKHENREYQPTGQFLRSLCCIRDVIPNQTGEIGTIFHLPFSKRDLVGVHRSIRTFLIDVMHAFRQVPIKRIHLICVVRAPCSGIKDQKIRGLIRIRLDMACEIVCFPLNRSLDKLVLKSAPQIPRSQREHRRQSETQKDKREDDAGAQPVAELGRAPGGRLPPLSRCHRARRSGSRCRDGSGSAGSRRACRPPRAGHGCARAGNPNPAVPRPKRGSPVPGG